MHCPFFSSSPYSEITLLGFYLTCQKKYSAEQRVRTKSEMQNPAHEEEWLHASIYAGDTQLKSSLVVKDQRVTADTNLNMSQQCVLETKRASGILGCSRRNVMFPGGCRKRLFPFAWYWVKPHLECCVQFCPTLFPPVQEIHGHTGKSLIKGNKND